MSQIKQAYQNKINKLLTNCLVFWAFNQTQFDDNKTKLQDGDKYISIGGGGYMPKSCRRKFLVGIDYINKWYKNECKNPTKRKNLIIDTLHNYEAFYTGELAEVLEILGDDFEYTEVKNIFDEIKANNE
jgi:hypothetical protein